MRGDIAVAGLVLTGDEWDALDERSRAQLRPLLDDGGAAIEYELYEVSAPLSSSP